MIIYERFAKTYGQWEGEKFVLTKHPLRTNFAATINLVEITVV